MIHKFFSTILIIVFFSALTTNTIAQEIEKDSTRTTFRKGRWLIGLSGAISSGSTKNTSNIRKTISNRYRIEISAGKFIMDRLSIGPIANLERQNFEGDIIRTTENLIFGPKGTYYLSKCDIGSLFFNLSQGLMLYRDEIGITQENRFIERVNSGVGFGTFITFGYSYAIYDRITLDLGLNYSIYWIDIDQETLPSENITNTDFVINDLSFSFGFKVLLD